MDQLQKIPLLLDQRLYRAKLTSGLTVYLHPRQEFHEVFALMTVDLGSANGQFKVKKDGEVKYYPAGIAHFLEHKMFEREGGKDAIEEFLALGAHANAFTNHHQTSYFFSTTQNPTSSLSLLQDMLSQANFTELSIEREKKIISQEIQLYQDDPDSRLYEEILASLYPGTPLQQDIAGDVVSVHQITEEMLREHVDYFYQPQRMSLWIAGNFQLEEVWEHLASLSVQRNRQIEKIERIQFDLLPVLEKRSLSLEVATPKLALGIRSRKGIPEMGLARYKMSLELFFQLLFGWTSQRYQDLYESGKMDSSFQFHVELRPEYQFFILTTDTVEPIALVNQLKKAVRQFEQDPTFTNEHFELVKREAYGDYVRMMNSLEGLVTYFSGMASLDQDILGFLSILEELTLDKVLEAGRFFLQESDATDFIIFPK